jgi:hypothetical protein
MIKEHYHNLLLLLLLLLHPSYLADFPDSAAVAVPMLC